MTDWSLLDPDWVQYKPGPSSRVAPSTFENNPAGRCVPRAPYQPALHGDGPAPGPARLPYENVVPPVDFAQPSTSSAFNRPIPLPHTITSTTKPMATSLPRGETPRELRNKAEKQRRDKLTQSIAELSAMVPPVVASDKKIDRTGVLRLTAHYLRAHQYVFGDSIGKDKNELKSTTALCFLRLIKSFLLTTTYKGVVVVVSSNVEQYLGYTELDLLGHNILTIVHEDDRQLMKDQLRPTTPILGKNGRLSLTDQGEGKPTLLELLREEKRKFNVRFKKMTRRSEPDKYITCTVEGTFRKSDKATDSNSKCKPIVRRSRARGENPCASGNDIVFIGVVRPYNETFMTETEMEASLMEYRTRHSVDGEIIQCEPKISLVAGYMLEEVKGANALTFMHKDDVRWVVTVLDQMYRQKILYGESCYRLITKNGQLIYMKSRGCLEVDELLGTSTTFVCTNTLVDEEEGKYLIQNMKKQFTVVINNQPGLIDDEDFLSLNDSQGPPIEDAKQLEKVILHLVTNIHDESTTESPETSTETEANHPSYQLTIVPPDKERIIRAIAKVQTILNCNKNKNETASIKNDAEIDHNIPGQTSMFENYIINSDNQATARVFENIAENLVPKVTDQVLASVQLGHQLIGATTMSNNKRQAENEANNARSFKRKSCGNYEPQTDNMNANCTTENFIDNNDIDALLDDADLQSDFDLLYPTGPEELGSLPDILLGSNCEDLFAEFNDPVEEVQEVQQTQNSTDGE